LKPFVALPREPGTLGLETAIVYCETGIAVPRLVDPKGSRHRSLWHRPTLRRALRTALLGGRFVGRLDPLSETVADVLAHEEATVADRATGGAMLLSARCRGRFGAWDESFFLCSETTEYLLRARTLGYSLELAPGATALRIDGDDGSSPVRRFLLGCTKVAFYRRTLGMVPNAPYWLTTIGGEAGRPSAGLRRRRIAIRALISPIPRVDETSEARESAPGWVCYSAQDWWYHNHGHSDLQLMSRIARNRTVLLVNSIGMRMPVPGRSSQFTRRLLRKARSTLKGVRRPIPDRRGFHLLSPGVGPFYGSATARKVNRTLVRVQVRVVSRWLGIRNPVQMVTIPTAWEVVRPMRSRAVVFNRSDKHSAFGEVDGPYVECLERQLLTNSDAVVYVSHALMDEEARITGKRAHFLDHGVDLDHFRRRPNEEIPSDLTRIPGPRIGFFGSIDNYTVDVELLGKVARRFPDVSLVLIGDATCPLDELESQANVHLLGPRPYAQIPAYGSGFDVALMPWLQNEWIAACNPIKVKEYLALGLPVVSMWYAEAARYQDVMLTTRSHDEFLDAISAVLAGLRPASAEACRSVVLDASWDACADRLRAIAEGSD